MSSEVDICNLALAYLGDDATVASIDPPEGSAQADHCARFYPLARGIILDGHKWNFATTRASLALLAATPPSAWAYAYALPADLQDPIAVLDPYATDDNSLGMPSYYGESAVNQQGIYATQPYIIELISTGALALLTNQQSAVLRYTANVIDTSRFPPLVMHAITMLLTSMLAGPVLKGESGIKAAMMWADRADKALMKAKESDSNQQSQQVAQNTSWLAGR